MKINKNLKDKNVLFLFLILFVGVIIGFATSFLFKFQTKNISVQNVGETRNYVANNNLCLKWYTIINDVDPTIAAIEEIWVEDHCNENETNKFLGEVSDPLGLHRVSVGFDKAILDYPYAGSYVVTRDSLEPLNLLNEYWDSETIIGWFDQDEVVGVSVFQNPEKSEKNKMWIAPLSDLSNKKVIYTFDSLN